MPVYVHIIYIYNILYIYIHHF